MKQITTLVFALLALITVAGATAQSSYPDKPVRIVVGFAPGAAVDISARLVGQKLSDAWGKPVLVENIAGAGGTIAVDRVAKSKPDGYTLVMAGSPAIAINPSLYGNLPYDPVRDFAPVTQVCFAPNILAVHNAVPARSVRELVTLARSQPGKLTFASAGTGTSQHIAGELFKSMAGIDIQHVPYKGTTTFMPDLIAGRVAMTFGNISVVLPAVREGKLRALAVTSAKRSTVVPDLPTMAESGFPGFDATVWFGILAPARTPAAIVSKLHLDALKALALPDLRNKFADLGMELIGNSPEEFSIVIKSEIQKWAKIIKESGAKPD